MFFSQDAQDVVLVYVQENLAQLKLASKFLQVLFAAKSDVQQKK